MFEFLLSEVCGPIDLASLEPRFESYTYETRNPDGEIMGPLTLETIEETGETYVSFRSITERMAESGFTPPPAGGRFQVFGEVIESGASRFTYTYQDSAVEELTHLEPGDVVRIPVRSRMRSSRGTFVETGDYTVTHEGCHTLELGGEDILVHRIRAEAFNQYLGRGGDHNVRRSETVRDISPALGWWVKEHHRLGTMTLVNVGEERR